MGMASEEAFTKPLKFPISENAEAASEWKKDWFDEAFEGVVEHWRD